MLGSIKEIEKIYYTFDRLSKEFADFPDTTKANDDFWDYMEKSGIIGNAGISQRRSDIDDLIGAVTCSNEKQGFVYGFQYALSLILGGRGGVVE